MEAPLISIEALASHHKLILDNQAPTQNDQLAQRITLVQTERKNLALELELSLKHAQPPTLTPSTTDTGTSAAAAATKKKRHVDWH